MNSDLSSWDVSQVTTLYNTFRMMDEMNSDLSTWNVAQVTTLEGTFNSASKFVGTGLGSWDTAAVTSLRETFYLVGDMNSDLSKWSVAKVKSLSHTFYNAGKMNSDLSGWNVNNVDSMENTFNGASSLGSCNKRKIADAWAGNLAFKATTYTADWTADACPIVVRSAMIYRLYHSQIIDMHVNEQTNTSLPSGP